MKHTFYLNLAAFMSFFLLSKNNYAQPSYVDTVSRQPVIDNIIANYTIAIGHQSRLYNGPEYDFYDRLIKGSAYFKDTPDFVIADVEYDGFVFKGLSVLYDLNKDAVVMQLPSKIASIELLSPMVQRFDILGHHFKRMDPAYNSNMQGLVAGFYDQLYTGKTTFIAKREKVIQNNTSGVLDRYFTSELMRMYLFYNGAYRSFTNKNSMLDILRDKQTELKQFIKQNHLKFRQTREDSMIKVVAYYDQITK
ncbi:hypothetical protein A0256_14765 [Mucilaginibacter sp. PAMC 26640]|nr:hypothetical protein A0256_14765 [Mucilaginibacter sp. PAMC 26640]